MSRALFEREEKERGDEVPLAFWKELYADTRLLHMKIDSIGKDLGIPYLARIGYFDAGLVENVQNVDNNIGVPRGMGAPLLVGF